ncbi:hypothetical protein ILUMI_26819 [Ignelater luminosus]|uniref:C2H2-type domain-containing protein n=1 Tax=Ignelater luminosus TaxID=2038154 RepID=A0A8K0C5B0_IGNLU|nr:hypothetical protein ILUMI_26819 [Ignelater luminosus]
MVPVDADGSSKLEANKEAPSMVPTDADNSSRLEEMPMIPTDTNDSSSLEANIESSLDKPQESESSDCNEEGNADSSDDVVTANVHKILDNYAILKKKLDSLELVDADGNSRKTDLLKHQKTRKDKNWQPAKKCVTCGKVYTRKNAFAMHLLTHKRAYACGICDKQFSRQWSLAVHLRLHTGEKPYQCGHCGKAYSDRSNFRTHIQLHMGKTLHDLLSKKTSTSQPSLNEPQESECSDYNEEDDACNPNEPNNVVATNVQKVLDNYTIITENLDSFFS